MLVAKQVADFLTLSRVMIAFGLGIVGILKGAAGLPEAVCLLLLSWTTDSLDGPLARRSRVQYRSWFGDHDLEADIAASIGLLVYLMSSGFVNRWVGSGYFILMAVVYYLLGSPRSMGMLFQAPIYGWFMWVAVREIPPVGILLWLWIILAVLITWPRFPKMVVPEFIGGIREIYSTWAKPK